MDSWIKDLWNKNKILFILLIPVVIAWFFREALINILIDSSKKNLEEAKQKDEKLSKEQEDANQKADKIREDANDLSNNKPTVDEGWHKNDKE